MRRMYDATPQETVTLDADALRTAASSLGSLLEPLWPALCERARRPRLERGPWPEIEHCPVEVQYLVSLALDCASWARIEVTRAVISRHVADILRAPPGPRAFRPDVDVRLRLVAAAAASDARITAKEKVN